MCGVTLHYTATLFLALFLKYIPKKLIFISVGPELYLGGVVWKKAKSQKFFGFLEKNVIFDPKNNVDNYMLQLHYPSQYIYRLCEELYRPALKFLCYHQF
jgi:hypothetical protein